jgi:hypothetical protein
MIQLEKTSDNSNFIFDTDSLRLFSMIENIYGRKNIFGDYIDNILTKMVIFRDEDNIIIFNNNFKISCFMTWYSYIAIVNGKINNSVSGILIARYYYSLLNSEEISNITTSDKISLLKYIEEVDNINRIYNGELDDIYYKEYEPEPEPESSEEPEEYNDSSSILIAI